VVLRKNFLPYLPLLVRNYKTIERQSICLSRRWTAACGGVAAERSHRQEILIDSGCQLLAANAGDVMSTAGTKLNRLAAEKNILK